MSDVLPSPAEGSHGPSSARVRAFGRAGIGRGSLNDALPCGPAYRVRNPARTHEDRS